MQFTAPAGLKVPAAHVAHALPGVGEPMPAAQSAQLAEPSVDVAPAAQGRQVALLLAPVALLKVAAGHGCGAAPAAQKKPALHRVVLVDAPGGQLRPAAHALQTADELAPTAVAKVPPAHCVQDAAPAAE